MIKYTKEILLIVIIFMLFQIQESAAHLKKMVANNSEWIFDSYLDQFIADANKRGIDLSHVRDGQIDIYWGDTDGDIAEAIGMNEDDSVQIIVNPIIWTELSELERKEIMYHEFGHDILNLEHTSHGIMMDEELAATDNQMLEIYIEALFNLYNTINTSTK